MTPEDNTNKYIPPPRRDDRKNLEIQRMREGKCRRCGDRWNPKHRCLLKDSSKKLYTCEAEENSESEDEEEATANMASGSDETPKISLAAMTSISQPQTLKLKGI